MRRQGVSSATAGALFVVGLVIGAGAIYLSAPSLGLTTAVTTYTVTATVTTTLAKPGMISLVGAVKSNGIGTTVKDLHFTSPPITYNATIHGNNYNVTLPNSASYTVTIDYNNIGGLPGGNCVAGVLPLFYQFSPGPSVTINWSC